MNDAYGHAAGDEVLRRVAAAISGAKRGFDSAARVGGEEFAVLAPDCDEHGAYMLAERIRAAVHEALSEREEAAQLTISFGISTFPLHGQSADALLRTADQALYAAKRLGRNRSVISSAEVPGILAPRARAANGERARGARRAAQPRRGARRARRRAAPPTASGSAASPSSPRASSACPPSRSSACGSPGSSTTWAGWRSPTSCSRSTGRSPTTSGRWCARIPAIGARMVETTEYEDIRSWILFHHERPDGRGYPEGRGEDEVPLESAIIAVADAYEAMTSERPYRPALAAEDAAEELRREAGRQFRADVVDALLRAV